MPHTTGQREGNETPFSEHQALPLPLDLPYQFDLIDELGPVVVHHDPSVHNHRVDAAPSAL